MSRRDDLDPCAKCHHSRPVRRQWTIPGTMCISMLPSARQKARMRCQESRLRPPVSWRDLGTGDCIEIAPAHGRSQSRSLTPHPSFLPRREKHGDTHSARNRPLATNWSRMASIGMQVFDQVIKQYMLYEGKRSYITNGTILGHFVEYGQTRPLRMIVFFTFHAPSLACIVRDRDNNLP